MTTAATHTATEEELATTTPATHATLDAALARDAAVARDASLATTAPIEATATPVPPETWTPPENIDHFEVIRRLGQGGMGAVYLARDTSLDRQVALKLLPVEMASNAEAQERFIREARAQAKLTSPNVVQIYFIGRLRGRNGVDQLYFAMEHVDGESLEQVIDRGERLPPERARKYAIQAAEGLRDAQQAGIIHRDVKPGNMLVDRKGVVLKIADFGLAKPKDPTMALTKGHAIMGTPLYMPPEQATGDHPLDHRADMYSLGCALYHLLTGDPPFTAGSAVSLLLKHVNEPVPPLRSRAPGVPPKLAAIIEKLLGKKPSDRFATYDELLAALDAAAPERVVHAGFWTRGGAAIFDAALASVLIASLGWPGLVLHLVYVTASHALWGQTLGKYLLRIQVRRLDGSKLGPWRSLARTFSSLWLPFVLGTAILWTKGFDDLRESILKLSELETAKSLIGPVVVTNATLTLLFASGFLLALIQRQKRAIHDFVAGTEVIFRIPEVKAEPAAAAAKTN